MCATLELPHLGVDVVVNANHFHATILDQKVGGARVIVPGHPSASGVSDDEASDRSDERAVDVSVGDGAGVEGPVRGVEVAVARIRHRGAPEVAG